MSSVETNNEENATSNFVSWIGKVCKFKNGLFDDGRQTGLRLIEFPFLSVVEIPKTGY